MLEKIQKPNDIKKIPADQLPALAEEIREFIIESLSKTGGHLASNLGVVELTIAMHRVFDLPKDKLIWDVGHQSYTHKILTGRKDGFETLRREGGISGFPKRSESDCDVFDTGHRRRRLCACTGTEKRKLFRCFDHRRWCADRRHGVRGAEQCGQPEIEFYYRFK